MKKIGFSLVIIGVFLIAFGANYNKVTSIVKKTYSAPIETTSVKKIDENNYTTDIRRYYEEKAKSGDKEYYVREIGDNYVKVVLKEEGNNTISSADYITLKTSDDLKIYDYTYTIRKEQGEEVERIDDIKLISKEELNNILSDSGSIPYAYLEMDNNKLIQILIFVSHEIDHWTLE